MRFLTTLAFLLSTGSLTDRAVSCTVHEPTPGAFTVATPDAEYVVAVVRPWEHLSAEEVRTSQRYPQSGVYTAGPAPELLWTLPITYGAASVRAFFSQNGKVYLVLSLDGLLQFYEDGELTRELTELDFLSAPWRVGVEGCRPESHSINISGSSLGSDPHVIVTTSEGSELVFSARTAELLAENRPLAFDVAAPTAQERRLAQILSDLSALGRAGNVGAFAHELPNLLADLFLKSCLPESMDRDRFGAEGPTVDPEAAMFLQEFWSRVRSLDANVIGLERLRTPGADFAFYRVPEGEAIRTLCGIKPLPATLLAAHLAGSANPQEIHRDLAAALNGPTVISAFVVELPDEPQDSRLVGVAALWSKVGDQWKVIAFNPFLPQDAPSQRD